jgi:Protein of unknown function (DUF1116)
MNLDPCTLAYERIVASHPWLTGVRPASEVLGRMRPNLILHASPPTSWGEMSELMRGGMIGAALFEGLASSAEEAAAKAASGEIQFDAAQNHGAMTGGVGSITASLPVMVVEDKSNGNKSCHFLMEGLGRTLVAGAYDDSVLERLRWFRDDFGPLLDEAIRNMGGIDLRAMMAEALLRGDELHNRNRAATSLFTNTIALSLIDIAAASARKKRALQFLNDNGQFFVSAVLPATELMLRAARGIRGCSVVTAIGANSRDCGLKLSGLGDRWFTAPGDVPAGILQAGVTMAEIAPGCGDSFLAECAGFGASVLPAAPALGPVIGASADDAARFAERAYAISLGEHPDYRVPALGFRGIPVGVDARKVVQTGTLPVIDIMMVHRVPGIGLAGMGTVSPPMQCFEAAVAALDAG